MSERRRKFRGWGYEDEGPTAEQQSKISALLDMTLPGPSRQRP